jgi:hypothetical protein
MSFPFLYGGISNPKKVPTIFYISEIEGIEAQAVKNRLKSVQEYS